MAKNKGPADARELYSELRKTKAYQEQVDSANVREQADLENQMRDIRAKLSELDARKEDAQKTAIMAKKISELTQDERKLRMQWAKESMQTRAEGKLSNYQKFDRYAQATQDVAQADGMLQKLGAKINQMDAKIGLQNKSIKEMADQARQGAKNAWAHPMTQKAKDVVSATPSAVAGFAGGAAAGAWAGTKGMAGLAADAYGKARNVSGGTFWVFIFLILALLDWAAVKVNVISAIIGGPFTGYEFPVENFTWGNFFAISTSTVFIGFIFSRLFFDFLKNSLSIFLGALYVAILVYMKSNGVLSDTSLWIPTAISGVVFIAVAYFFVKGKGDAEVFSRADIFFIPYAYVVTILLVTAPSWLRDGEYLALAHLVVLLIFSFAYIQAAEGSNAAGYYGWSALFFIVDFFSGQLFAMSDGVFRYLPVLLVLGTFYVQMAQKESGGVSPFVWLMVLVIFGVSAMATFGADASALSANIKLEKAKVERESILDLGKRFISDRVRLATQFQGEVEQNQYESLGVYFSNVKSAQPRFYKTEPIIIWADLQSKTYQGMIVAKAECSRLKGSERTSGVMTPKDPVQIFQFEEVPLECQIPGSAFEAGSNTVELRARYNFLTNAYQKVYFMDQDRYRSYIRENIDPLTQLGIKDKAPTTVFTNGPVEIGMKIEPLIRVSEYYTSYPLLYITLTNREAIEDKDRKVVSRWEGRIENIKELVLLLPPGIVLAQGVDSPCSPLDFKKYEEGDCTASCEKDKEMCMLACPKNEKGELNSACDTECGIVREDCEKECGFMLKTDEGGKYNAYALDTTKIEQSAALQRDYRGIDRFKTFACRIDPTMDVLENSPLTTRYIRVRAKYDYLLANTVTVQVDEDPAMSAQYPREPAYEVGQLVGIENPDLLVAIASIESSFRHCCKEAGKNTAGTCVKSTDSADTKCEPERILTATSESGKKSIGYMQVNVNDHPDIVSQAKCREGQTLYDLECNILAGATILKQYYDEVKGGQIPLNRIACKQPDLITKYRSYRGWDSALRLYHGTGCAGADYVEKMNERLKSVKDGKIVSQELIEIMRMEQNGTSLTQESGMKAELRTEYDKMVNRIYIFYSVPQGEDFVRATIERKQNQYREAGMVSGCEEIRTAGEGGTCTETGIYKLDSSGKPMYEAGVYEYVLKIYVREQETGAEKLSQEIASSLDLSTYQNEVVGTTAIGR